MGKQAIFEEFHPVFQPHSYKIAFLLILSFISFRVVFHFFSFRFSFIFVLILKRSPFAHQKDSFYTPKGLLLKRKRTPFAKP